MMAWETMNGFSERITEEMKEGCRHTNTH